MCVCEREREREREGGGVQYVASPEIESSHASTLLRFKVCNEKVRAVKSFVNPHYHIHSTLAVLRYFPRRERHEQICIHCWIVPRRCGLELLAKDNLFPTVVIRQCFVTNVHSREIIIT